MGIGNRLTNLSKDINQATRTGECPILLLDQLTQSFALNQLHCDE